MTDIAAMAHRTGTDRKAHGAHGAHKAGRVAASDEGAAGIGEFAALFDSVTGVSDKDAALAGRAGKAGKQSAEMTDGSALPGAEAVIAGAVPGAPIDLSQAMAPAAPATVAADPAQPAHPAQPGDMAITATGKSGRASEGAPLLADAKSPAEPGKSASSRAESGGAEPEAGKTQGQAMAKPEPVTLPKGTSGAEQAAASDTIGRSGRQAGKAEPQRIDKTDQSAKAPSTETTAAAEAAEALTVAAPAASNGGARIAQAAPERAGATPLSQGTQAVEQAQDQARNQDQPAHGDGQPADHRRASAKGEGRGNVATATADSANGTSGTSALRDIVQSLPPFIQAQLGGSDGLAMADAGAVAAPAAPSTGALLGDKVIDMGVSGQWIDTMAREIAELADGSGHSRFQLNPPNLGRIQVDLWQGDDATNVRIMTETDEAARRLREGQDALETNARVAALSLGTVTVEKSSTSLDANRDQNGGQNSQQNQRQAMDFGGQPQQQAGGQAQGQSEMGAGGFNRGRSAAVIGNDQAAEAAPVASPARADDRRVRYA